MKRTVLLAAFILGVLPACRKPCCSTECTNVVEEKRCRKGQCALCPNRGACETYREKKQRHVRHQDMMESDEEYTK